MKNYMMQSMFSHCPSLLKIPKETKLIERYQSKKPFKNSNNASMSLGLCSFDWGLEIGGDGTFGIGRPFGKSKMIKSNPPNLQKSDETRIVWA